jgi:hypothetical protein
MSAVPEIEPSFHSRSARSPVTVQAELFWLHHLKRATHISVKSSMTQHLSNTHLTPCLSRLRHYATSRMVADSIPDEVIGFFQFT